MQWRRKQVSFSIVGITAVAVVCLVGYLFNLSITPYTLTEVRRLTAHLNESAAVATPHHLLMDTDIRSTNVELLSKVEMGNELSADESTNYRLLYQDTLRGNRWKLQPFDWDLTVRNDHQMKQANNINSHGIANDHDHHDDSARANFAKLKAALDRIHGAGGIFASMVRIWSASSAYKDLTDIMLHLGTAPHTVSVGYDAAEPTLQDDLSVAFEEMLQAFKEAQFQPVNSQAYVKEIRRAMDAYDHMVLETQAIILFELSLSEQQLAGRWLAPQTFSPSPDLSIELRFER